MDRSLEEPIRRQCAPVRIFSRYGRRSGAFELNRVGRVTGSRRMNIMHALYDFRLAPFMLALEFRHLRTLAALRDTGSLVEAAERVFLTQSALSHQLKDLEDKLGCQLFVRKTRPLRFTSAGKRLQ